MTLILEITRYHLKTLSIETKMTELSRQKNIFHRQEISKKDALGYFTKEMMSIK